MDFELSDLQRMLLDSAGRLVADRYTLEHRRALRDSEDGIDFAAWARFAELGWLALAIPEERGGLGGSLDDVAVLMTALGEKLVTEPYVTTAVLAAPLIAEADGDREALLAAIAAGEIRVALAHDEPGERYGSAGARTTTLRRSRNSHVLNGRKMLVLDAPSAQTLIVSARRDDEHGFVLALVGAGAAGVTASPYPLVDGSRAADVRFDEVVVSEDAILAVGGRAATLLVAALDRATIAMMAQAVGSMEACLRICSAYLKERHQFGQPIGKFQALQHIMADMFVAAHQSRSALYQALAHADGPPAGRGRAISLARLTVGAASQLVSRQAIQLHGGYGMTDEYEVSHHFRRLLVIEKLYGDLDFHTRRLAAAQV